MSERIIWIDKAGYLVDGGEPDAVRYIRCDLYEILAEALGKIADVSSDETSRETAYMAFRNANDG